jgi:hypothetical protein
MTIASTTNRNDYVGTNTTAIYNYGFKIFTKNDLLVTQKDTSSVESTLVVDTDYTVLSVGDVNGGTITLTAGNLATGYTLTIRRVRSLTQSTDIRNGGDFYAESHEDAFDHFVMLAQQQQDEIDRSIKSPESISSSAFSTELPTNITTGGGRALKINDAGTGFELGPTATQVAQYQDAINSAPPWYNVLDYLTGTRTDETIIGAMAALEDAGSLGSGAKYGLLLKRGTWTIDANITIPANVFLIFEQGTILNISTGFTISYSGPNIIAPNSQIFSLTGTGAFNFLKATYVHISWWLDSDAAPALQASINALNAGVGGELRVDPITYTFSSTPDSANKNVIALKSNVHINCPVDFAEFDFDGLLSPNVINTCMFKSVISNFKITGVKVTADATSFVNDGYSSYGIWLKSANNCHIERCRVEDVENGFIFGAGCYECSMIDVTAKDCYYHSLGVWSTSDDPCLKMTFKNIKAYGTGSYSHTCAVDGFNFEECYDSVVDDVTCWNVGVGVRIENSCDNKISNITCFENWKSGFLLYIDTQRNNITNVTVFDNNKGNEDAIDTSAIRGNDWNHCEGFRVENNCDNNNITNVVAYQTPATIVPFTSGSDEPALGCKLEGATDGAAGRVRKIEITSGSWVANNAAGNMHLVEVSGTFNASEVLKNVTTIIPFNSGSVRPKVNEVLTGATSGASGTVLWVSNQGAAGTDWTTGDASGFIYLTGVTGGPFNASENLNNTTTSTSNVATTNGAATPEDTDIATTNGAATVGTGSNKGFQKYGIGINIRNLTGNDTLSAFNNFCNVQSFNNDLDQIEDRGNYNKFLNVTKYYNNMVRNTYA